MSSSEKLTFLEATICPAGDYLQLMIILEKVANVATVKNQSV